MKRSHNVYFVDSNDNIIDVNAEIIPVPVALFIEYCDTRSKYNVETDENGDIIGIKQV